MRADAEFGSDGAASPTPSAVSLLPFVHSPQDRHFASILATGALEPVARNLFLFYARPSYCLSQTERILRRTAFLLEIGDSAAIDRIYPFDSGGFKAGRYSGDKISAAPIDSFRLESRTDSILPIVRRFYGNNKRYYHCDPTDAQESDSQLDSAYRAFLHRNSLRRPYGPIPAGVDVISHSIEVQVGTQISLHGNLRAIVVPRTEFAQNPALHSLTTSIPNVKIIRYPYSTASNFAAVREQIFHHIASHYRNDYEALFSDD